MLVLYTKNNAKVSIYNSINSIYNLSCSGVLVNAYIAQRMCVMCNNAYVLCNIINQSPCITLDISCVKCKKIAALSKDSWHILAYNSNSGGADLSRSALSRYSVI